MYVRKTQRGRNGNSVGLGLKGQIALARVGQARAIDHRPACCCRAEYQPQSPCGGGYPTAPVDLFWAAEALPEVTGYLIEHNDGFRTTTLLTGIADFNYAGITTEGKIFNCQMMLPMPNRNATTADFFNPLVRHIENMVLSNQLPYPVERTLLTSGMVIGG